MKKIFTTTLLVATAFSLSGCALLSNILNKVEQKAEDDANAYNGYLFVDRAEAEIRLDEAARNGYYVRYEYSTNDEQGGATFAYKNDTFLIYSPKDNQGYAVVKVDGGYDYYQGYEEKGTYTYVQTDTSGRTDDYIENWKTAYKNWVFWANAYDGNFKKGNDAKVAGRACYTYDLKINHALSDAQYRVWVDKEIGITLKLEASGSSDEGYQKVSYEMKEIAFGSNVRMPELVKG